MKFPHDVVKLPHTIKNLINPAEIIRKYPLLCLCVKDSQARLKARLSYSTNTFTCDDVVLQLRFVVRKDSTINRGGARDFELHDRILHWAPPPGSDHANYVQLL